MVRRAFETSCGGIIAVPDFHGPGVQASITIVKEYKHLGTRLAASDAMGPEVATNIAVMSTTLRAYSHRVLRNNAIDTERRHSMSRSLVLSSGIWAAGAWPARTPKQEQHSTTQACKQFPFI